MRHWVRLVAAVLLTMLLVVGSAAIGVFMANNSDWVPIRVPELRWTWPDMVQTVDFEARLSWLLLCTFAAGVVAAILLVTLPAAIRSAWRRKKLERHISSLREELADLRSLPVMHPAPLERQVEHDDVKTESDREGRLGHDDVAIVTLQPSGPAEPRR